MTFNDLNLNTPLLNAIEDLGFLHPTPIQKQSFSLIMSGKDLIATAQTGTGKTLAYLLPVLRQLSYSEQKNPRVLILVPTRELVLQITETLHALTKYMSVRITGLYGGTNINTQKKTVYKGADIVVATPGRLYDIAITGLLRLKDIRKLIIDEVDEMLNLGFRPQLLSIFEILPAKRQNLMFSATLSPETEGFIAEYFVFPEKIQIAPQGTPLEKIEQISYRVPNFNTKINLLNLLLQDSEYEKVLIFASSKRYADLIHGKLSENLRTKSSIIHSNKSQNFRINSTEKFKKGEISILIATDIAARGLDISDVSHVINFSLPEVPSDYIHRIGRTGRADKAGTAINFVSDKEDEQLCIIEELMQKKTRLQDLPENLKISAVLTEEEKHKAFDKNYLSSKLKLDSQGAFHEKKDKNKKVNSGSPSKKRKRNKKNIKRSGKGRKNH